MNHLIIYAHPNTCCFCPKILEQVELRLNANNQSYEVLDLYKMRYNPVLNAEEHYTSGNNRVGQINLKIQDKIKKADHLIFIYPVWWGSMPAILKGFFDRVLTPGFAFVYEGGLPKRLLKDKKAIVFMTSGGPKTYYFLTGHGNRRVIKRDILWFCGIKTKIYQVYNARKMTQSREIQIAKLVDKVLSVYNQH